MTDVDTKVEPDCSCVARHRSSNGSVSVDAYNHQRHGVIVQKQTVNTSGAAVFIHSSIFCLIFMEKFKYENSPEYSADQSE